MQSVPNDNGHNEEERVRKPAFPQVYACVIASQTTTDSIVISAFVALNYEIILWPLSYILRSLILKLLKHYRHPSAVYMLK